MRHSIILIFITPCLLLSCCNTQSQNELNNSKAIKSMPRMAFDMLKSGNTDQLSKITMSAEDFLYVMKIETRHKKIDIDPDELSSRSTKLAESCLKKAKRSLVRVRESTTKDGFDWSKAELESIQGDPLLELGKTDIWITIKSVGNTIRVKLDDCIRVNDKIKLSDGFRLSD